MVERIFSAETDGPFPGAVTATRTLSLFVVCCCFSRSYLLADGEILENICNENDKDAPHIVGE
jgi:hypothetical protein